MPVRGPSVRHFCQAFGISEAFFYKLKKQGEGPKEMCWWWTHSILEAASAWIFEREGKQLEGRIDKIKLLGQGPGRTFHHGGQADNRHRADLATDDQGPPRRFK